MKNVYKKLAALTVMGCVVLAAAGAQEFKMSAGGGGLFNANFGSYSHDGEVGSQPNTIGGGAFLFFDATYAEIDLDILLSTAKDAKDDDDEGTSFTHFGFSLLGKYPIGLGSITLFPLLGIDYQSFQYRKSGNYESNRSDLHGDDTDMYDLFAIALGVGLDYPIGPVFLRAEALLNIKLNSTVEKKLVDDMDMSITNLGPRIKLGVGYTL